MVYCMTFITINDLNNYKATAIGINHHKSIINNTNTLILERHVHTHYYPLVIEEDQNLLGPTAPVPKAIYLI